MGSRAPSHAALRLLRGANARARFRNPDHRGRRGPDPRLPQRSVGDPMSTPTVVVLEEITCVAPLGLRFWDVASARAVGAGLTVQAYPAGVPGLRMDAVVSRRGVYSFRGLPGMRQ